MITIKSNIEFLKNLKEWIEDETYTIMPPRDDEIYSNIDYAVETLKMIDQLKDDAWDEKRADIIGQNSNEGLHYK